METRIAPRPHLSPLQIGDEPEIRREWSPPAIPGTSPHNPSNWERIREELVDRRARFARLRRQKRWLRWGLRALAVLMLIPLTMQIMTITYVWHTPPTTKFMQRDNYIVDYQFVSIDHISRHMIAAAIVHEDSQMGFRAGPFDVSDFIDRAMAHRRGEEDMGGSTIPQQLVKNIFLSEEKSAARKAVEAVWATQFNYTLPDSRIMELYLNYAQFGPKLYGICAASWYYFNTPPWYMNDFEAAQLASILPLPTLVERAAGGGIYINPEVYPKTYERVWGEVYGRVPGDIKYLGGWEGVVAQVGIHDSAADHAGDRGEDSCSSMPEGVAERLQEEGAR